MSYIFLLLNSESLSLSGIELYTRASGSTGIFSTFDSHAGSSLTQLPVCCDPHCSTEAEITTRDVSGPNLVITPAQSVLVLPSSAACIP